MKFFASFGTDVTYPAIANLLVEIVKRHQAQQLTMLSLQAVIVVSC